MKQSHAIPPPESRNVHALFPPHLPRFPPHPEVPNRNPGPTYYHIFTNVLKHIQFIFRLRAVYCTQSSIITYRNFQKFIYDFLVGFQLLRLIQKCMITIISEMCNEKEMMNSLKVSLEQEWLAKMGNSPEVSSHDVVFNQNRYLLPFFF